MVTTFNKRELLEFPNWTIEEHRLPKKFKIQLREGFDINPLYDVLERLGSAKNYREDDLKCVNSDHIILIEKYKGGGVKCAIVLTDSKYYKPEEDEDHPFITEEELASMLIYENTPLMTDEHLDNWLKFEKYIEFLPCLKKL